MLSRDEILSSTQNGMDIFRHYLGQNLRTGRKFRNPLYQDTHASCSLYFDRRSGVYKYKDFGNDEYAGDCFELVAKLHNLSCRNSADFIEILRIINRDLNLGLSDDYASEHTNVRPRPPEPAIEERKPLPYTYRVKPFSETDLIWWSQYGIDLETLKRYKVVSLAEYNGASNSGNHFTLRSLLSEPMFGYIHRYGVKVYRPKSKSRFVLGGKFEGSYCFGLEQLSASGDVLLITGGEKDVLSLAAHGFPAICFGSETVHIPNKLIDQLSHRFKRIILLYDMDKTGVKFSSALQHELQKYNVSRLELPLSGTKQEKDISDYFRLGHTAKELQQMIKPRPIVKQHLHDLNIHKPRR